MKMNGNDDVNVNGGGNYRVAASFSPFPTARLDIINNIIIIYFLNCKITAS